jgi:AbrB family looped-hinge helix DNA binding protein
MTYKVGPKGQVVLPKEIRTRLGIEPGDEVLVDEVDGEVRIRRVERPRLLGMLADYPGSLTKELEEERRREREREEAKHERLDGDRRP